MVIVGGYNYHYEENCNFIKGIVVKSKKIIFFHNEE